MPIPALVTEKTEGTIAPTLWNERFAQRTQRMGSSIIRELLKYTEKPDVLSFAGGLPAPEVFPFEEVKRAADAVLEQQGRETALQYSPTEGYLPLRELLVRHMSRYGIMVTPANVLITTGSQQGLDLIGRLFVNPGDRILTESPTYLGALQAWSAYQADYLPVPIDDDGLDVDQLEAQLRGGPKFLYILPNFQNPAGVTLGVERRRRLVELANHYGAPIVEDDPYGQLRYEGEHIPPLVQIDAEYHLSAKGGEFTGDVLYLSTLSKTLAPGLRVAWVVAPESVTSRLVQMKQGADLHSSTFCQMVAYEVAKDGFLDRHVKTIREVYGQRLKAMLAAFERHFPEGVQWTRPQGGLFLWVTLPPGFDSAELLKEALGQERVAFVPGAAFYPRGGGERTCRLNFSYLGEDMIDEGIRRLGTVIKRRLVRP